MKYTKELSPEEVKYICKTIPFAAVSDYFRRYPKEFAKLRPGFRVKSLTEEMMCKILYDFRTRDFIDSFITKVVDEWIKEIDEALNEASKGELSKEAAYIEVLSQSYFCNNVSLYFKIKDEKKSEEYLYVLGEAVSHQMKKEKSNLEEFDHLKKKEESIEKQLSEIKEKLNDEKGRTDRLRKNLADIKIVLEEKNESLESEKQLNAELSDSISALERNLEKNKRDLEKKAEEYVEKTSKLIDSYDKQIKELKEKLVNADSVIDELRKLERAKNDSNSLKVIIGDLEKEIETHKEQIRKMEELNSVLEVEKDRSEKTIRQLSDENNTINDYNSELQCTIRELEKVIADKNLTVADTNQQNGLETAKSTTYTRPLRPIDMNDFDEYFLYNITNIGFNETDDGGSELIDYIKQMAFKGIPLLIKRGPAINLANCLSNAICGQNHALIIPFARGMEISDLESLLNASNDRVICLDGFIGNWNEIELIPLLNRFRNKIIILTFMYDKTLRYIPSEILSEVCYIYMDRFNALLRPRDITEDPSEVLEKEYISQATCIDVRSKKIFMEIAQECNIGFETANALAESIEDEASLNRLLLFTLLPYVASVMEINPYNCSKRLQKYAGESGRCLSKDIMMRWFGSE